VDSGGDVSPTAVMSLALVVVGVGPAIALRSGKNT
jgi:hypothetical protein